MDVKTFDSLCKRDFDNGAVRDDIRKCLQELAECKAENERLKAFMNDMVHKWAEYKELGGE